MKKLLKKALLSRKTTNLSVKKPVGLTGVDTKNGGAYLCESKLILHFCKSLITKHSHGDTGIKAKNQFLKQAKMVSV